MKRCIGSQPSSGGSLPIDAPDQARTKQSIGFSLALGEYALLWRLVRPFLARHKRLREDFPLRLVPPEWGVPFPSRSGIRADFWIQAASGGEAFLALQLLQEIDALASREPGRKARILCTSCTRQGLEVLQGARERWAHLDIAVRVFPLDEPEIIRRAREYAAPGAVVLLETELWPGLMAVCAEKGIPLVTVNGRMTEKSYTGYRWFARLWKKIAPARILGIAKDDAARFAALFGAERISVMPNMKFDGVPPDFPPPDPDSPAMRFLPPELPVILLASVREEEEPLLAPVLAYLREHAPDAAVVVAPRHMERAAAWRRLLEAAFGAQNTLSLSGMEAAGTVAAPRTAVLWDRFGQLQSLYGRASAVFVGGSLAKLGGQNFLEAAGQGKVPLVGPHWKNFQWVGEEFFSANLGKRVANAGELGPALVAMLRAAPDPEGVRRELAAYLAPRRGGTRMAAEAVWAFRKRAE